MCQLAQVSRSGYYAYVKRLSQPSLKEEQDKLDFYFIKKAFDYKGYKKGSRQIKLRLERDYGLCMNRKKIQRLMRKYHLVCPLRKVNPLKAMFKSRQLNRKIPNRVERNFNQGTPKKILLTDITYITYGKNKRAYLSTIKDSTTKMILAHRLSLTLDIQFVLETVKQLHDFYKNELRSDSILHSDQGVHYTSYAYQSLLKEVNITPSMSRRGNCWDNAPQESFFALLKTEINLSEYKTFDSLALAITDYINYYNYDRPQIGIHKMTPYEYDDYLSSSKYSDLLVPALIAY